MKNTIKVTIPFSFKGMDYTPSAVIDLDKFVLTGQTIDSIFQIVARQNNIDAYSYEYEVLESAALIFSEPTGLAVDYLSANHFDFSAFKQCQKENSMQKNIQQIAEDVLGINDLDDVSHKQIKQALIKAYQAGATSKDKDQA